VRRFLDCGGDLRFDRSTICGPIEESFLLPRNLADYDAVGIMELTDETLAVLNRAQGIGMRNEGLVNRNPAVDRQRYGEAELKRPICSRYRNLSPLSRPLACGACCADGNQAFLNPVSGLR
jgi:hypothetical protein